MQQNALQMRVILLKSEDEIRYLILYTKERLLHEDVTDMENHSIPHKFTKLGDDKYHEWLKKKKEYYDYATQFDVFYNMKKTMEYYNQERDMGIDWTLPVLQENYSNHLALLRPKKDDYLCLGEVHGKLETEDQIRKLPRHVTYHGLAKGQFLEKNKMGILI